jgi:predicted NAD/FAD-dependent oxidoreductase
MVQDTIIVGAGVAGLRCAGELARAGRSVLVLDRARDVGGRCATRRFEGQPVDFGPMFLHGDHPGFTAALAGVTGATPLRDWPRRIQGGGQPCQPGALDPAVRRVSFAEGLKAFPRHLARGLEIRLETPVTAIRQEAGGFELTTGTGPALRCRDLVLALAMEQSRRLLATLADGPEVAGIQALLGMFGSVPSLTLITGYPLETPEPPFDLCYPDGSDLLQLIAHDSGKRPEPKFRVLVAQARPRWSRLHLETPVDDWSRSILAELAEQLGPWAAQPLWRHPHRWRHARVDATTELAQPVRIGFPGGHGLGLAGDVFAPGGGVQAAWLSGTRLAQRMIQEGRP